MIAFLVGVAIGGALGVFAMSLAVATSRTPDHKRHLMCEAGHKIITSRSPIDSSVLVACPARTQCFRDGEIVAEGPICGADIEFELIDYVP